MTNLERIKDIDRGIDECVKNLQDKDITISIEGFDFLLKAFRAMQKITIEGYLDGTYCSNKKEAEEWLIKQFEERMNLP